MIATIRGRRFDVILLLILLAALRYRAPLALYADYNYDEEYTTIPLSQTISFAPGRLSLPIRGENHPALPAYVAKASSTLFGTSNAGYRAIHVLLGLSTIVVLFFLTREWYGPVAARWAAALLAFNDYFLTVSARVTAHAPHLFLVTTALYTFSRFLRTERPAYLYAAGASVGIAFYAKEHAALLLPVFLLTLLHARYRQWLRTPHPYLAAAVFILVIGPDLIWNLTRGETAVQIAYGTEPDAPYNTYGGHLQRIGGLGVSPYPLMFYARGVVMPWHERLTGTALVDEVPEYRSLNRALGALFLGCVLITTLRPASQDRARGFLLLAFWVVFGLFTLIRPGNPPGRLDPVSWIWVEATMLPAIVFAGARLSDATGKWRIVTWAFAGGALAYAVRTAVGGWGL